MGWFRRKQQNADADRPGTPIVPKQHVALIGEGTLPGHPHDGRYWVMRTDAYDDGDFRLLWEQAATYNEAKQLFYEFGQFCGANPQRVSQMHRDEIDGFWVAPAQGRVQPGLNITHPQNIGGTARYHETRAKWGLPPDPDLNELRAQPAVTGERESRRRLTALESGKALSTALETLCSAADDWYRVISAPQARNAGEFIEKWKPAYEAPAKVDRGLADLVVGFPPDDYMDLYKPRHEVVALPHLR